MRPSSPFTRQPLHSGWWYEFLQTSAKAYMSSAGTTCVLSQVLASVPLLMTYIIAYTKAGKCYKYQGPNVNATSWSLRYNFNLKICICSFEHRNQIDDDYGITSDVLALVFRLVWQCPF